MPHSAADDIRIGKAFHTIILAEVPMLDPARRDEAKRLINLVDTLYDLRVRLITPAAAEPSDIWTGDGVESREFARTVSRLIEMWSDAYWLTAASARAEKKTARAK